MIGKDIFIAMPVYGGIHHLTVHYLFQLCKFFDYNGISYTLKFIHGELVEKARQILVSSFLKTDATDLLFIDTDAVFTPQDFLKLLYANVEVIGGLATQRRFPIKYALRQKIDDQETGVVEITEGGIGMHFTLIRRSVLEKIMVGLILSKSIEPPFAPKIILYGLIVGHCFSRYLPPYRRDQRGQNTRCFGARTSASANVGGA